MHIDNLDAVRELKMQRDDLLWAKTRTEANASIDVSIGNVSVKGIRIVYDEQNPLRDAIIARINERLDEVEHELAEYGVILAGAKEADDAL